MGAIFLAVWGDNLAKGLYSGSGWHRFVSHYAATTKIERLRRLLAPR